MEQIKNRDKAIKVGIIVVLFVGLIALIGHMARDENTESNTKEVTGTMEIDDSYIVLAEAADYTKSEIYEIRVYNYDRSVGAYCNGEKKSDMGTTLTAASNAMLSFHPEDSIEKLTTLEPYKIANIDNAYNVDLETSEKYVGYLINNSGYILIRSTKTSEYCDMYLKKGESYRRIIVAPKKLIEKEFVGDITLEDIKLSLD